MLIKASFLCCLLILTADGLSAVQQGYYTMVAPGSVRTNTPYHVSVSLSDFHKSTWFNISLTDKNQLQVHKAVEVQPGTTKLISLHVPKLQFGAAKLSMVGYGGIASKHEASVSIEDHDYQIYIQTDKPRYRPGELVQFRVICIDELTRPAVTDDILEVLIYDIDENLVQKIENIKLNHGVFKGQLQLSEDALLGAWQIKVQSNSSIGQTKVFQVSRYTLPRFSVEIVTKPDVYVHENKIEVLVKARYAHGEPFKGDLSMKYTMENPGIFFSYQTVSKEMQIDGYQLLTIDLNKEFDLSKGVHCKSQGWCTLSVDAELTDSLTKQFVKQRTLIAVHRSPYKIRIDAPKYFDPKVLVDVKVSVTDLDNKPVQDKASPVMIWVKPVPMSAPNQPEITYLNDNGVGIAQLNLTNFDSPVHWISAEFNGNMSQEERLEREPHQVFTLNVLTHRPEVGEEIVVEVKSSDPIDHFVYEIVSRGNIFKAERVHVPEKAKSHLLRISTTHAMVPRVTLYIHRVRRDKLDSAVKSIHIGKTFQNSIEINAESQVRPGASVSVNVSTDEDSYVGLLGIDQRLLLDTEREEDFTQDRVLNRLTEFDARNLNQDMFRGSKAGLVTFSNTYQDIPITGDSGSGFNLTSRFDDVNNELEKELMHPRLRRIFSDGWLFDDFERTPRGGLQLHSTIPDAITSWAITGFSLNPTTGLSLTRNATKIRVFQPFFVSMDLPTSIREDEIIEVPIYVFNYNKMEVPTEVIIESQSEHLLILDEFSRDSVFALNQSVSMSIHAQGSVRFTVPIKTLKAGRFNITVKAISKLGSDALQKTLTVVPKGIPHQDSRTYLVHFLEESVQTDELEVSIPEEVIPGSEKIELSVVGDTFGPLVESLRDLVQVPYGNGRETTMLFISNILVLKYLKTFNLTNPSLERKALIFLRTGYQSLLGLKHLDGSFSFFERSAKRTGDTLQTAIVMWGLQQAKSFIHVDPKLMARCLNYYLKPKQEGDGGFRSGAGLDDDVTLTALALLVLMEDEESSNVTSKGLDFLYKNLDDIESPLSVAISKYVLVIGRHERSREILRQLSKRSARVHTGQQMLWAKPASLRTVLETTSGSLLNILRSQTRSPETLMTLVTTLLASGNSEKIPTHLLALDAMIGIAQKMHFGERNLNIHFEGDQDDEGNLKVHSRNVHVLQTVQLNGATRKVRIQSNGKGFAVVTIKSKYNVPIADSIGSVFNTNVTVSEQTEASVTLKVCVSNPLAMGTYNFTAVEVNLPSGYTLLEDQNETPLNSNLRTSAAYEWFGKQSKWGNYKIRTFRIRSNTGSAFVIFEDTDPEGICINLSALRSFRVLDAKQISVVAYNVYNEAQKSITFHNFDWIEETR